VSPEILRREIIGLGGRSLRKSYFGKLTAHARAYDLERKRAEALSELDRAKTAFFSNVSHEFRTLTLILGPLEALIAEGQARPQTPEQLWSLSARAPRPRSPRVRAIEAAASIPWPTDLAALTVGGELLCEGRLALLVYPAPGRSIGSVGGDRPEPPLQYVHRSVTLRPCGLPADRAGHQDRHRQPATRLRFHRTETTRRRGDGALVAKLANSWRRVRWRNLPGSAHGALLRDILPADRSHAAGHPA
jgi:hypothetical protein